MPAGSLEVENTFGDAGYGGPQPPRGTGAHDYRITVHALGVPTVGVDARSRPETILRAIRSAQIEEAGVTGMCEAR